MNEKHGTLTTLLWLDIGWDEKFSPTFIKSLERVVSKIDAVLLSYPDIAHLG